MNDSKLYGSDELIYLIKIALIKRADDADGEYLAKVASEVLGKSIRYIDDASIMCFKEE